MEKKTIPLAEETIRFEVQDVETGRVRVTTSTEFVNEIIEADLVSEAAEVTRVPIGQVVQAIPPVRNENGVTIVPVLEEVVVIERQLVLKEELHIRVSEQTSRVSVPVQLRKQHAKLERQPSPDINEADDD